MKRRFSNFTLHALNGIFGSLAMSFIAAETILPGMLAQLDAPPWMISLSPAIFLLGFALPGIVVSPYTDPLERKYPFLMFICMPVQKIPYFLMPLWLLWISDGPTLAWLVFISTFIIGAGTGIAIPAWVQMIGKTVRPDLVPRLMAARLGFGGALGVLGGFLVKITLSHWPDRYGYALLFTFWSLAMTVSMWAFYHLREPREAAQSLAKVRGNPVSMRELLRCKDIVNYLLVRMCYCGTFLALGFVSVQFMQSLKLDEGYLGIFAALVVGGAVAGNLFISYWTRRFSVRSALKISLMLYMIFFVLTLYRQNLALAFVCFFILGFARDTWESTGWSLMVSLPEKRMAGRAGAMMVLAQAPPILCAGFLGGKLLEWSGSYNLVAVAALLLLIPAYYFAGKLPAK